MRLEPLFEREGLPQIELPEELREFYGGGLGFASPVLYTNFVETIDGIVSIPEVPRSNAIIAHESDADRCLMGLLRALADVVVIGSGTMLAAAKGTWRPDKVYPPSAGAYADLRRRLGKTEQPAVAIVTAGGSFDPGHPVLETGALVLTTAAAAASVAVPPASEVVVVNDGDWVDLPRAIALLHERGYESILSEGGPTIFTALVAAGLVDELFLTVSPLVAGRLGVSRLSLGEGATFLPELRVVGDLLSVRKHESHLFMRYRLQAR